MDRIELLVVINGTSILLDTFGDGDGQISIPLNYNIADINNIESKNSSYSKTISLPNTKVNRQAFEYIFDLNANSTFDPTKKSKCYVLRDTVINFEGNLQMTGIVYDRLTGKDTYECVIYADNDNLFVNIGEKYISDLNLPQISHTYSYSNVINSWSLDYTNGYYYPLIDYSGTLDINILSSLGTQSLTLFDFYPTTYVKPIIDEIFTEAGFNYTSDFLNSNFFKNLILPFNNAALLPTIKDIITENDKITLASFHPSTTIITSTFSGPGPGEISYLWTSFDANIETYDPNNFYDTTNFIYTHTNSQLYVERFKIDVDILVNLGSGDETTWSQSLDNAQIVVKRSLHPDGSAVSGWSNTQFPFEVTDNYISFTNAGMPEQAGFNLRTGPNMNISATGSLYEITGTIYTDYLQSNPLRLGEQVRFFLVRSFPASGVTYSAITINNIVTAEINTSLMALNAYLTSNNILPQNIKQKDLLTSVIKMFNLYIEPDKYAANNFIIEPRDQYYSKYQVIKDWTQKLDLNQPIQTDFLSNTQVRRNIFTYKEDKDYWNTIYTSQTKQIAGQYEWDINNDFITSDDNTIQPIFSPTIIDKLLGSTAIYFPTVVNYNNGNYGVYNGMNIRLLYKNTLPVISTDKFYFYHNYYPTYPYAGPYDDPLNPTIDLNFGYTPAFYPGMVPTFNNLFYNYYQDQMVLISDKNSRIITAHFNLTSVDISQFKFSDLIFFRVDGSEGYYRVNKIMDYDPSQNTSTQVELITAQNYNIT